MRTDPALVGLFASVFITSLGIATSIYYVPLYIAYLGAGIEGVALMGALRALAYALLPAFIGRVADIFGRTKLYALSILLNALALFLMAFSSTLTEAYASSLLMGVGYAFFWPVSSSIAASISSREGRLRAMAIYSISWSSAFLLGPLLGAWLRSFLQYWALFFASGLIVLLAPFWLRWLRVAPVHEEARLYAFPLPVVPLYIAEVPHGIIYGVASSILPYYMAASGLSDVAVGALFGLMGAVRIFPLLALARRGARELPLLLLGAGLFCASFSLVGLSAHLISFALSLALLGLGLGLFYPAASSLISRHFPSSQAGFALGLLESVFGVGMMAGPPLGEALYRGLGPGESFVVLAALTLTIAPLALLAKRLSRPSDGANLMMTTDLRLGPADEEMRQR